MVMLVLNLVATAMVDASPSGATCVAFLYSALKAAELLEWLRGFRAAVEVEVPGRCVQPTYPSSDCTTNALLISLRWVGMCGLRRRRCTAL